MDSQAPPPPQSPPINEQSFTLPLIIPPAHLNFHRVAVHSIEIFQPPPLQPHEIKVLPAPPPFFNPGAIRPTHSARNRRGPQKRGQKPKPAHQTPQFGFGYAHKIQPPKVPKISSKEKLRNGKDEKRDWSLPIDLSIQRPNPLPVNEMVSKYFSPGFSLWEGYQFKLKCMFVSIITAAC